MFAGLIGVVWMAKLSIALETKLRRTDRDLAKIHCSLEVSSSSGLEGQNLALIKP